LKEEFNMVNVKFGQVPEEQLENEIEIIIEDDVENEVTADFDADDWFSKLAKNEIITGEKGEPLPTLAGLRRLAKPFIQSEHSVVNNISMVTKEIRRTLNQWVMGEDGETRTLAGQQEVIGLDYYPYASVTFTIVDIYDRTWSDSADAYYGNCNDLGNYPTAVASARAEGRVLRKLLGIKEHVFEEISSKQAIEELTLEEDRPIAPEQKKVIETILKKVKATLKDLFGQITTRDVTSLDELTAAEAIKVIKLLNEKKKESKK
jgi:hypothetical protein